MMNRRDFTFKSTVYLGGMMTKPLLSIHNSKSMSSKNLPGALNSGDTIALIAPGSSIPEEKIEKAKSNLHSLGLKTVEGRFIREKYGYTAGKDQERISDIHWAFGDNAIDAIWCIRGGYGCTRLLPHLNYDLIKKNPKILIGYSDITALHMAIFKKTGLTTFHGPVGSSEFTSFTSDYVKKMLFSSISGQTIEHYDPSEVITLSRGTAKGKLIGGNLSLISAMCGTKYLPSAKGKIVFLEDIDEKPYRIDRMLVQLEQAWDLKKAKGIILGEFEGCDSDSDRSLTLLETLENHFKGCRIPVLYKMPLGHIDNQATYPIGIKAEMDAEKKKIVLLEEWVKD
ncbi:MAG: LD-carboxypeptidase [Bacteroidota bacterium]